MANYRVTSSTDDGTPQEETFDFPGTAHPHSTHLVEIMRKLDEQYRTLQKIEVTG